MDASRSAAAQANALCARHVLDRNPLATADAVTFVSDTGFPLSRE